VHQDCLSSWLAVTRGGGRCELCSTRFHFAPKYADGAPEKLSAHEVLLGLSRRTLARWLPLALRTLLAIFLWLCVMPLATAYLYLGWLHKPSFILQRWTWELIPGDTISGVVIAAVIILSFLSLMSFADFLRFHWQQPNAEGDQAGDEVNRGGAGQDSTDGRNSLDAYSEGDVNEIPVVFWDNIIHGDPDGLLPLSLCDNRAFSNDPAERSEDLSVEDKEIWIFGDGEEDFGGDPESSFMKESGQNRLAAEIETAKPGEASEAVISNSETGSQESDSKAVHNINTDVVLQPPQHKISESDQDESESESESDAEHYLPEQIHEINNDDIVNRMLAEEMLQNMEQEAAVPQQPIEEMLNFQRPFPQQDRNNNPPAFDLLDAVDPALEQDDNMDMEIHLALDELLGLRGPITSLVKNLFLFLGFNATYLGIFAFIPRSIGKSVYSIIMGNSTILFDDFLYSSSQNATVTYNETIVFLKVVSEVTAESRRLNTAIQSPDLGMVGLGYFTFAIVIFLFQALYTLAYRKNKNEGDDTVPDPNVLPYEIIDGDDDVDFDPALDVDDPPAERRRARETMSVVVDSAAAVVKVCCLLSLKMVLLPILLGVWLDASTLALFDRSATDRSLYAGSDLFGAMLLHWVAGITFMLLTTVFVLQLREVAHPGLLAKAIRPQEPQPDLLGNLLQDGGLTHAKRTVLSLGIYAAILIIHVWLPARLMLSVGLSEVLPLFRPNFYYLFSPQLQVPIELLIFHLTMLAFLEKYKNHIGEMQHHWLLLISRCFGLSDCLLPHEVDKFVLVGASPIFISREKTNENFIDEVTPESVGVDPFWRSLIAMKNHPSDNFIVSNIQASRAAGSMVMENSLEDRFSFIRLPSEKRNIESSSESKEMERTRTIGNPNDNSARVDLLPTHMGAYRLQTHRLSEDRCIRGIEIEFWREVMGSPIPRPPEGWDDLGLGGAEDQGRWAWGNEKKSETEISVAKRRPFFSDRGTGLRRWVNNVGVVLKVAGILVLSWLVIMVVVSSALNLPLVLGRCSLYLLRVPEKYMHDPLAFAIGGCISVPFITKLSQILRSCKENVEDRPCLGFHTLVKWLSSFKRPRSRRKVAVLFAAGLIWFAVAPTIIGSLYDLLLMKSSSWWEWKEALIGWTEVAGWWGTGLFLLNVWAAFCYFGMGTQEFWIEVIGPDDADNQDRNRDLNQARNAVPVEAEQDENPEDDQVVEKNTTESERTENLRGASISWQGPEGRVAEFIRVWNRVLLKWEWDKIDHVTLLENCALPIVQNSGSVLCISLLTAIGSALLLDIYAGSRDASGFNFPIAGFIGKGIYRSTVFRLSSTAAVGFKLARSFQKQLQRWFRAAHMAARDDRYLVGKVLMNYTPLTGTQSQT